MRISAFFPAHNEKESLRPLVKALKEKLSGTAEKYEIIIVDDGSTDATGETADGLSGVRVIHHGNNLGYGAAIRSGIAASKYECIFYTDGDYQFEPEEIDRLLPFIKDFDIVTGYRIHKQQYNLARKLISFIRNLIDRLIFGLPYRDLGCAFKLFRREIFSDMALTLNGMMIETEIFLKAKKKGYKIKEVGVSNYPRAHGKGSGGSLKMVLPAILELGKLILIFLGG